MHKDFISLSFSLFSNKCVWHKVLKDGIVFFLEKYESFILNYSIELNYLCGENIRLSIVCNSSHAEMLSSNADVFFKDFFGKSTFPTKEIILPIEGLFLPFPCNTIQYGLYKNIPREKANSPIENELSKIIVAVLAEDLIDDESILTLALYLHLGLLSQMQANDELVLKNLIFYQIDTDIDLTKKELMQENYELNKSSFFEIFCDVFYEKREKLKEDSPWLDYWLLLCANELKINKENINILNLEFVAVLINKHLGVNNSMKQMVNSLLTNLLKENLVAWKSAI